MFKKECERSTRLTRQFEKICVVGLGYIGLPTAAMFASRKVNVLGVDINKKVVDTVNQGNVHIVEPALDAVVKSVVLDGYLRAATTPEPSDAFLISVPTPFMEDRKPDLSYVKAAAKAIAPLLQPKNLVILESTSPVGATEQLSVWLSEERSDLTFPHDDVAAPDVHLAHCPERVLPGNVMRELVENDRIIGGITETCTNAAIDLYRIFVEGSCLSTNVRTAEMCKLVENSFRDVNIAFANELSLICSELDIDVWQLIKLANRHPRVSILQPSCGVGGHCIAVDPWFIVSQVPEKAKLIRAAREVNDIKPKYVVEKISSEAKKRNTKNITILGLAFKPDIDDVRESPALEIAEMLLNQGFHVRVVDPYLEQVPEALAQSGVDALLAFEDALRLQNTLVAILVAHKPFREDAPALREIAALDFCGATND